VQLLDDAGKGAPYLGYMVELDTGRWVFGEHELVAGEPE
jgi:hypothetical protein